MLGEAPGKVFRGGGVTVGRGADGLQVALCEIHFVAAGVDGELAIQRSTILRPRARCCHEQQGEQW